MSKRFVLKGLKKIKSPSSSLPPLKTSLARPFYSLSLYIYIYIFKPATLSGRSTQISALAQHLARPACHISAHPRSPSFLFSFSPYGPYCAPPAHHSIGPDTCQPNSPSSLSRARRQTGPTHQVRLLPPAVS
jgi:hypothetical protein